MIGDLFTFYLILDKPWLCVGLVLLLLLFVILGQFPKK